VGLLKISSLLQRYLALLHIFTLLIALATRHLLLVHSRLAHLLKFGDILALLTDLLCPLLASRLTAAIYPSVRNHLLDMVADAERVLPQLSAAVAPGVSFVAKRGRGIPAGAHDRFHVFVLILVLVLVLILELILVEILVELYLGLLRLLFEGRRGGVVYEDLRLEHGIRVERFGGCREIDGLTSWQDLLMPWERGLFDLLNVV
jgi:hypothetical protein